MSRFLLGMLLVIFSIEPARASCSGDCGGNGEVTVDELILGVNLALGSATVAQCSSIDANHDTEVTIDELIVAVSQALNGCPVTVAGDYSGTVTLDPGHYGIVNLSIKANNQANGSLLLTTTAPSRSRFAPSLSFNFPVGGASVALSGVFDPAAGGFEVTGSFIDGSGATVPVVISGSTAGLSGNEPVNVYVGTDVFTTTLSSGIFPTPTPTVTPTPSPGSGARIVYSGSLLDRGLFVVNLDGSGKAKITNPAVGQDSNPAWSPDGSKIAFATPDANNDHITIGVANADGSNFHRLSESEAFLDGHPAWSPDGSKIAFTSGGGDHIDAMSSDGSGRHRLVTKIAGETYGHLSWSPDGGRIAFESSRSSQSGGDANFEIYVMNADGSNIVRLTNNAVPDHHPDWSPNGQKIIFSREDAFNGGLMSIKPDGSGESRLAMDPFGSNAPNWSRDGQSIAYGSILAIKITNANGGNAMSVPGTSTINDFDFK